MRIGKAAVVLMLAGCGGRQGPGPATSQPQAEVPFAVQESTPTLVDFIIGRPAKPGGAAQIAAGSTYVCGLGSGGRVVCWGTGAQGQLGGGQGSPQPSLPVEVPVEGAQQIAAGAAHACALRAEGEVVCWGSNARGQLGLAGGGVRGVTRLPSPRPIKRLADNPLCAVTVDDEALCWGEAGGADDGEPQLVAALPAVRSVAVSDKQACAAGLDGEVRCWGQGAPTRVGMLPGGMVQVAVRSEGGCSLDGQGQAYCWGAGQPRRADEAAGPAAVRGLLGAVRLTMDDGLSCALRREGTVACWGDLLRGGPWSWDPEHIAPSGSEATEVPGVGGAVDLTTGRSFSCALRRDGHVVCWGSNESGVAGTGTTEPAVLAPRVVPGVELR